MTQPYLMSNPKELDYVDYNCYERGINWKLFGDYTSDEFDGTNVEIVDGNLRVYCPAGSKGQPGVVRKWPMCRDTTITSCDVSIKDLG